MRATCFTLFLLTASTALCQEYSYFDEYRKATFGLGALPSIGLKLGFAQVRNSPHEWGRDWDGFGKRAGSVVGGHLIGNTVKFSVARIRHEEVSYRRSDKSGIWPRLGHAVASSVVTRDINTGEKTVALGRISGAYASGLISRTWQPERLQTVQSGLSSGTVSLGLDAVKNVLKEFWPDIRHPHRDRVAEAYPTSLPEDPRIAISSPQLD